VLTIPIQALTVRELETDEDGNPLPPDTEKAEEQNPSATSGKKARREEFEGVFVVKESKAEFVTVKTGITGNTEIEIDSGLEEGAVIVTGSYKVLRSLNHGDRVKVDNKAGE
jgi:hypothetical protein